MPASGRVNACCNAPDGMKSCYLYNEPMVRMVLCCHSAAIARVVNRVCTVPGERVLEAEPGRVLLDRR